MHVFYAPEVTGDHFQLEESESKHAIKVLRMNEGDQCILLNGKGSRFVGELISAHPKRATVQLVSRETEAPKTWSLHIAIAPTKNISRLEWFLEKATEIGIDQITPIFCANSERTVVKPERLEKVLVAAMKQSMQWWKPVLNPATTYTNFLTNALEKELFIAHCNPAKKEQLFTAARQTKNAVILIGPEGDFSQAEIDWALEKGAQPVALGNSRLRTETAGLVACHTVNLMHQ